MNNCIRWIVLSVSLFGMLLQANAKDYKSTFDYIQKNFKLWGISAVIVNKDDTITLVDRKEQGYGYALTLADSKNVWVDEITLNLNEVCLLADFHHAFIIYKLIGFEDSNPIIEVTDKFDARSFGDDIREETKIFIIVPYNEE